MSRLSLSLLLVFALALAGSAWLVWHYGAEEFAVQLASGFVAALAAFVLALAWERDRERRRAVEDAGKLVRRQKTEVRRRLSTVRDELSENLISLRSIDRDLAPGVIVNPQLLAGAWTASAPSLAKLLADYELTADAARIYDRIEELRWRLRTRTTDHLHEPAFDDMIRALAKELIGQTEALEQAIVWEIDDPAVQGRLLSLEAEIAITGMDKPEAIGADEESP